MPKKEITDPAAKAASSSKVFTIPNVLSFFRMLLVPVFAWIYLEQPFGDQSYTWTVVVLVISSLTDLADGQIARRCNMVSDLGKMLDPIADKLTQGVMMICLLSRYRIMIYPLVLLGAKEIINSLTHLRVIQTTGQVLGAVWHGKVATTALDVTVILHVLWWNIPEMVTWVLVGICVVLMAMSLVLYSIRNVRTIHSFRERKEENDAAETVG